MGYGRRRKKKSDKNAYALWNRNLEMDRGRPGMTGNYENRYIATILWAYKPEKKFKLHYQTMQKFKKYYRIIHRKKAT